MDNVQLIKKARDANEMFRTTGLNKLSGYFLMTSRRINGNNANHSTANKTSEKTSALEGKREPRTTEAEMAALIDSAEGKLTSKLPSIKLSRPSR